MRGVVDEVFERPRSGVAAFLCRLMLIHHLTSSLSG